MSIIRHRVGQPTPSPSFAVGPPTLCRDSDMSSVVDVDRWTAGECREYLRYTGLEYASAVSAPPALVSRVRTRLAALQLSELWPVDPRD